MRRSADRHGFRIDGSRDRGGIPHMIRLKTAVLLGFSLEYGAILGGMASKDQELLYEIGVNMGIGFQLMDDLLDVYADKEKFGKQSEEISHQTKKRSY